jgi:sugar phosphate isomerase/epimerase
MKLSFGSWALTRGPYAAKPVSFHHALHKLEDEGYQGIELGAIAPHPTPDSHATPEQREFLKAEVAEHGLAFSGLAPNLRGHSLVSSDECGLYLAAFERYINFASDVGIDTIRVDTVEPIEKLRPMGVPAEEVFDRAVVAFGQCAAIAAKRGLRVAWEFEPHLPLSTPGEIVELVDAVRKQGHASFGVLYDTSHAHICTEGGEHELLQALRGKISHVHLADSDGLIDEAGVSRHLPLGTGKLDFAKLLPELREAVWWTIDLYNCPDAWDAIASGKKFLTDRGLL